MPILRLLLPAALCLAPVAPAKAAGPGAVVVIGGALHKDNEAVWSRLVALAGGSGAKWVVVPTASSEPLASGNDIATALERRGARAEVLPVSPLLAGRVQDAVRDPDLIARVRASRGVYFAGGEQGRLVDALLPGGMPSPLLVALREMHAAGGVVAGSSAGAAALGVAMIRDIPDVRAALRGELRDGIEIDRGLGFLPEGFLTDQHFLKRGRIGRLLPAMTRTSQPIGVGVDEDTAAVFRGRTIEIVGARGVLVADLREARAAFDASGYRVANARLACLAPGDRYDPGSGAVTPPASRNAVVDPRASGFAPRHAAFDPPADILGDTVFCAALGRFLDSPSREAIALAKPAPGTSGAGRGFAFRLHKGPDTRGWREGGEGGEAQSIAGMRLDIFPLDEDHPLYAPSHRAPEGKDTR